jgi:2-polyprenyl-6-methoxyphenol hydroxylase-like FAD-dependent oxidoreductase
MEVKAQAMECDVLIVGAGPVGLMLSCELARRGISHRLIESKPSRERYCKALGVAPRTLELLDHMGLLDETLRRGFFFEGLTMECQGQLIKELPGQQEELPYGFFALAQPAMEEVLEGFWQRFGGRIERNLSLLDFEQDAQGVQARLSDGQTVRCRYLVGCDGAHSTVRKTLGTGFEGERFERTFLLCDVRLDWDRPRTKNWQFICLEDGEYRGVVTVIANPDGPNRYRISTSVDDSFDCPEHPSLELMREIVLPALPPGTEMSDQRWSSRYNISHRIADRYRTGRVFLAGDAAHIHPPIGGLGMNTGLQDAYNLGWKLAAVCRGQLRENLLDTYHDERHPVGRKVVEVTAARMAAAMAGQQTTTGTPEPPQFDTQLRIRYESGLLVSGQHLGGGLPRPGDRLPTVKGLRRPWIESEAQLAHLFQDGRFHLFTQGGEHEVFQAVVEEQLGELGRSWALLEQPPREAMGYLLDAGGEWLRTVGPGAVLVRPDGVIGWRGDSPEVLRQFLAAFVS